MLSRIQLVVMVGATCAALLVGGVQPAAARDLVKATAKIAMAQGDEEPPPTRSQLLEKERRENALKARQPQKEDDTPAYKKWWFWTLTAVVVGGTVALGAWAVKPSTPPARPCPTTAIGCFGDGR
jgi:hypothetical protein